jgi:membrane protein implicated in regulation of membrane protease activity
MDIETVYWHWLVLGITLIIAEMFIPSFTILWFGLGAVLVGAVMAMIDLNFSMQILLWTLASVAFTVLWFWVLKPKAEDRNNTELARQASVGEAGQVIKLPTETTNGKVRFSTPVLDQDEWEFVCDTQVQLGDRLHIKEISGNHLMVTKLD